MRIPENKIEEIRSSVNIVDFISGYVQLKKRGKNYVGLCPFHQEKTPSFTVSEEKQIFHCFGCHAGGNVYKFLMDYKSISFVEAVQEVADYAGISLEFEKAADDKNKDLIEELYEINIQAARYFSENLLKRTEGEIARNYFEKRNIKLKTQKIFGLGYALPVWDDFVNFCRENNIDLAKAKQLGLIDAKEGGKFYDKFKGRIIFPIFSPNGRVIAFGGRILEKTDRAAKYLNSPESEIYLKRKSLYGLYHSKEEIRKLDKAILVEGYMDLISLYQYGIKNVVASSGTSLTDEQARLLSRYTKNVIVIFDADVAGQKASMRSIEILLKQDFDVKILSLPENEDPDSFVHKYGKEEFEEYIHKAKNFLEYQTEQFEKAGAFEDPKTYAEAIRELVKSAALVTDELRRNLLIKSIARKFGLREKLIESELEKISAKTKRSSPIKTQETRGKIPGTEIRTTTNGIEKRISTVERELLVLLFEGKEEVVKFIFDHISPDDFTNKKIKELAHLVFEGLVDGNVSTAYLVSKIDDEKIRNYVLTLTLTEEPISSKWSEMSFNGGLEKDSLKIAMDAVKKFKTNKIDYQIKLKNEEIKKLSDETSIINLLAEIKELQEQRKQLIKEFEEDEKTG